MFDFHIHSHFSADSKTPMEDMITGAIQKGLKEICFTEHIDKDYPDTSIEFDLDIPSYNRTIATFQDVFEGKITIKKGVELGVQPHVLNFYKEVVDLNHFDFVICSMHTTKGKDLHSGNFFEGKSLNQAYEEYYLELLECIRSFDQYSILGHLDLVSRYRYEESVHPCLDIIEDIFKTIIPAGKGIEINTSGHFYGLGRLLPDMEILKLYKELNGEIITIGSDAHLPNRIAEYYDDAIELLKECGFRYIATFSEMKPVFHKL